MAFTVDDIIAIQRHLNLSPSELESGSVLRKNLAFLEDLDANNGTNKVEYVQSLVNQLTTLEDELDTLRVNSLVGIDTHKVDGQYQVKFNGDNKNGELEGKVQQYNKYLIELRREAQYEFDTYYADRLGCLIV